MEKYSKSQLTSLVEGGYYDCSNQTDRYTQVYDSFPWMLAHFPESENEDNDINKIVTV